MTNYKLDVISSNTFKKDLKKVLKQGKDIEKLLDVVDVLAEGKKLNIKYRSHRLKDDKKFKKCYECHIEPDWLLIWQCDKNKIILIDTGSHSEILNK